MHSSSHREDEVSEGARRNVRPGHQTTLKFNAAASDKRGQTSSEKSESENSDPTGDRARTKLKKKSKLAGRDSGCATFGAQRKGASLSDSEVHGEDCSVEPDDAELVVDADVRASSSNRRSHSREDDVHLSDVEFNSLDSEWQHCDSEVAIRCPRVEVLQRNSSNSCQLPAASRVPSCVVSIDRELERCRAAIERLTCEITKTSTERDQLICQSGDDEASQMRVHTTNDSRSHFVSRPAEHTRQLKRKLSSRTAVIEGRHFEEAFSGDKQVTECNRRRHPEVTVKPVKQIERRSSKNSDAKRSGRMKSARRSFLEGQMSMPKPDTSDSDNRRSKCKSFQQQPRSRRDMFVYSSSDSSADMGDELDSTQKQRRRTQYAGTSCSQLDRDVDHSSPRCTRGYRVSGRRTAESSIRGSLSHNEAELNRDRSSSNENSSPMHVKRKPRSRVRSPVQYKRDLRRDLYSGSEEKQRQQECVLRSRRRSAADSNDSDAEICKRGKSGGYMKPEKFSGSTCFETFLVQFDNCAKFNHWNQKDKLQYLRWSLTGTAAQMLWGTESMSFQQLVARLRSRFGSLDMEEKYQAELQCRRRKADETLRELAQDIRRLMMLAYPGDRSDMAERLAKEHFVCALDDPELEFRVREKEPQTLDAALKAAQRLEVFRNAVKQRANARQRLSRQVTESIGSVSESLEERVAKIEQDMRKPQPKLEPTQKQDQQGTGQHRRNTMKNKKSDEQRACATTVSEDVAWKEELLQRVRELEAAQQVNEINNKKIAAEKDALNKEVGRLRHLEQLRSVPAPAVYANTPQYNVGQSGNRVKACYNCGEAGHFVRSCPRPRRQTSAEAQLNANNVPPLQVNGTSGFSCMNHNTYLSATIGNRVYNCLLDTGSEVCLIPDHAVDSSFVRKTNRTLKAANGTSIPTLGEVTLPISIGEYNTQVTGLVSQHVSEPMLGIDFLVENKAVWDFNNSAIQLGNRMYKLHSRRDKHQWCRRVVLEEDTVVPARTEVNVATKVQFHRLPTSADDGDWGTEPSRVRGGLHVSRTLMPHNIWSNVPIRVMNVNEQPVVLKSGTHIADLQQVEVLNEDPVTDANSTKVKQIDDSVRSVPDFIQKLVDGVDDSIPESACLALEAILCEYSDVFSQEENDLGRTDIIMHHIDTGDARPVRQPLRRYPPAHQEAISQHVNNMLKQGTIEPASSPWASNVVLVKKKDGSLRCCIDYRQLNSVTKKDAYPLPRVDACLDAMASATLFSTFDLRSSYHQVVVSPEDRDKTTFICPRGMYRYRTMPFGLCNAGATFQRLMDVVMSGLHLDICLVYLDDIILFSRTVEEHLERLVRILARLHSAGLKLKPEKCSLMQRSVSFLGHVVSGAGIATDPDKTKAVSEWPVPATVKDVRSFLVLAGYYRRFVRGFAEMAAPLHALTKKDCTFEWTDITQSAFDALKNALTTPPVLAMPNDVDIFILDADSSNHTIGSVLSQVQGGVERVIAYASRTLDKREMNYCITRKELLAIVYSLKYFKQYLMGRRFKVRTDHAPLTWLRHTPDPIGQQARWLEIMEEFDFEVEHRPGVKHGNADALSRRPCHVKACVCRYGNVEGLDQNSEPAQAVATVFESVRCSNGFPTSCVASTSTTNDDDNSDVGWTLEGLRAAQEDDPDVSYVLQLVKQLQEKPPWESVSMQSHDVRVLWGMWPRLRVWNGLLQRKFESPDGVSVKWQVILPSKLRREFLSVVHSGMTGGHLGKKRTAASIQARAYWPTWSSDLDVFLKECAPCAQYHRGSAPRKAKMQTPLVGEPWIRISVDITGPHTRSSRSNQYILTLVDHFSKWAEAIPLRNHTAPTVARALVTHVFSRFGAPQQLLTDRGTEFESELFKELMRWMEIDKLRTTVFHPSCNGVVERFHRTLNSMLAKAVNESQRDWDERLPLVLAAYRATPHESTGMTPNKLFLGHEVRMPIDLVMGLPLENDYGRNPDDYVAQLQRNSAEAYELVRKHLRASAERRKRNYDIKVRSEQFAVGDWVFYHYPRRYQSRSPKWQRSYTGPYLIVRMIEPVNCVLQRSAKSKPFVAHFDKLKHCYGETPISWLSADATQTESN